MQNPTVMRVLYTRNAPIIGVRATVNQFDPDDAELCVKVWRNGQYCAGAEYYTEDLNDAIGVIDCTIQKLQQFEQTA